MKTGLEESIFSIDASGLDSRKLNQIIRETIKMEKKSIFLDHVTGQRYIASGLEGNVQIKIRGTPGNDLGAFMDGPQVEVFGNGQDCFGNTMNRGDIIIHGDVGDITGMSMRGGKIFVKGDSGYRTGVHMKEYHNSKPMIVIGGTAQDFLGEYMAGGVILLLGLNLKDQIHPANFVGTGMHGGTIFVRGDVRGIGQEVEMSVINQEDRKTIIALVKEFSKYFSYKVDEIIGDKFIKLTPIAKRPFENLFTH
jgi:glutamate synthase domain-containing protein 3